jgi:hypothetical protein
MFANSMFFESRTLWYPKDDEYAHAYEDSFCVDAVKGIVAIADGVSSAMFSKRWADLLTQGVVANPPDVTDVEAFRSWLVSLRAVWAESVDPEKLGYFERQKLARIGGGYSTLLWVKFQLDDALPLDHGDILNYSLRCWAAGDCCLFIVRDGNVLCTFPIENIQDFELDPISISSVDRNSDNSIDFSCTERNCQSGDLVILASDAFAKWLYQELHDGQTVDWEGLWHANQNHWSELVHTRRDLPNDRRMRVDDTTVVMLRMASPLIWATAGGESDNSMRTLVISPICDDATQSIDNAAPPLDDAEIQLDAECWTIAETSVEERVESEGLPPAPVPDISK